MNEQNKALPASGYTLGEVHQGPACCEPELLIQVERLSVSYHNNTVLHDVSLDIYKGCITALIGPSGCGKTSFLSCLNRLLDMVPGAGVSGRVSIDGEQILEAGTDVMALRRRVGMIFQRPNPFPLSIRRNLELPLIEQGIHRRRELDERIQAVLEDVGLWAEVSDRLDSPALRLSGGQQQRLCIARALILEPEVLLMDEPCSALDPISSRTVEELITRLRHRYTVIIVTHNLAQARRLANYVAFFWMTGNTGKLVEFGHSRRIFDSPAHHLTAAYVSGAQG